MGYGMAHSIRWKKLSGLRPLLGDQCGGIGAYDECFDNRMFEVCDEDRGSKRGRFYLIDINDKHW
jgi:hypothetical protein